MITANNTDKDLVIELLCSSFDENKSVNYVIKQDDKRKLRLRKLMVYSYNLCSMFGEIYLSDDRKGCALALFPENKKTNLETTLLDLGLVFSSIGISRALKVLRRDSRIKSFYPREPIYYLWFIGVHPDHQHQGVGSRLLEQLINKSSALKRPIYLETSMSENIEFYEKFGFRVYQKLDFGHTLYSMKRDLKLV